MDVVKQLHLLHYLVPGTVQVPVATFSLKYRDEKHYFVAWMSRTVDSTHINNMKHSSTNIVTAATTTSSKPPTVEIITPEPMNITTTPTTATHNVTSTTATTTHDNGGTNQNHTWQSMTRTIAHYERLEQIGLGTYGQVYRAICKDTGRIVAMKKMRNSSTSSTATAAAATTTTATSHALGPPPTHQPAGMPLQLIREIKILKQLQHPNLLSMIEVVTSKGVEHLDIDDPIPISSSTIAATSTHPNDKNAKRKSSKKDEKGRDKNNKDETKKDMDDRHETQATSSEEQQRTVNIFHQQRLERERYKGNLFLVLEYMTHDLTGLLDVAYEFSVVQIKCIMKQLLLALQYMHEHKFIHRDIKSSNILLDSYFHLKLADFGLARSLEPPLLEQVESYSSGTSSSIHTGNTTQDLTNKVITLWYRPPEILLGTVHYGCAVDVWSAGCILAELITGKPLTTGKTELDQLTLVADLTGTPTNHDTWEYLLSLKKSRSTPSTICNLAKEWSEGEPRKSKLRDKYGPNSTKHRQIPETALTLLEKVLEWDPRMRITAANALQHRYFWSQPVAPDDPAELGRIDVAEDGHFHEFVTKQKRKQAKLLAEQSRETALRNGATTSTANEKYDETYMGIMKQVAQEGFKNETTKASAEEAVVVEASESKKNTVDDDDKHRGGDRRRGDGSSTNISRRDRKHSRGGDSMEDTNQNDEYYNKDDLDHDDNRRRRQKKKRSSDRSDERSSSKSHHHHDKRRYSDDSEYRSEKGKRRSRKDSHDETDVVPTGNDSKYNERELTSTRNHEIDNANDKEKKSKKHSRRDSDSGRSKRDRHSRKSDRDGGKKSNDLLVDSNDRRGHDDRYHRRSNDRETDRHDVDRYRRPPEHAAGTIPPPAMGHRNDFGRPYDNGPPTRTGDAGGHRRPGYDDPPPRVSGGAHGDFRPKERRDNPSAGPVYGDYRPNDRRSDAAHHSHPHELPPPLSRNRERDGPSGNHYNAPPNRDFNGDRFQSPPQQRRDLGPGPYQHGRGGPGRGGDYGPRDIRPPHDDHLRRDRDGPRGDYGSAPPHPPPGPPARREGPVYGGDQFYRRDGGGGGRGGGGRRPDSTDSRHPRDRNR